MAHAVHQPTQVGTLVRGELITGMAQVAKVNRRESCHAESRVPDAAAEVLRLSGPPPELVNTSPSSPGAAKVTMCEARSGVITEGIATVR